MPDSYGITGPSDPKLRRVIVEHEVEPGSLLQKMSMIPTEKSKLAPERVDPHALHSNIRPLGRIRVRKAK